MGSHKPFCTSLYLSQCSGQSAILITVLLCLVVLAGVSASLGIFNQQSAQRNISTKSTLQSYYVAMQGIQEALGTRMIPRSNQLNYRMIQASGDMLGVQSRIFSFGQPADPQNPGVGNVRIMSYYNLSGLTFTNVRRMPSESFPPFINPNDIMGAYRYIVVGGDPSRRAENGRYYFDPGLPSAGTSRLGNANSTELKLISQPFAFPVNSSAFFIVSNGITCVPRGGGVAAPGQIIFNPYPQRPTCRNQQQFELDETNLVARVELEHSRLQDLVQAIKVFEPDKLTHMVVSKPDPNRPDPNQNNTAEFPFGPDSGGAFIPGILPNGGEFDTFRATPTPGPLNNNRNTFPVNFEDLWRAGLPQGQTRPNSNTRLTKIMVFQSATTQRPLNNLGVLTPADYLNAVDENVNIPPPASLNTPTTITLTNPLRVSSTIRLYFNGGVDIRSIYRYQVNNCSQKAELGLCNIQLRAGAEIRDFNFVPLLPSSNSIIITPSYVLGQTHTLTISGLRTYAGVPIPPVNIVFQVRES
jgi:hypothetical protein